MQVMDRDVENLSGGELQRFAMAVVAAQEADVYMIDEPSSYLDVRQRLKAAQVRRLRCHAASTAICSSTCGAVGRSEASCVACNSSGRAT